MEKVETFTGLKVNKSNLDFSYLNTIPPYKGDKLEFLKEIDIKSEIEQLNNEIQNIDIRSIPFDKWDYIVAFTVGILEVAGDFLISDHNQQNSIAHKLSDKNSKLGEYFNNIHEKIDHSGQPVDYQGPKFGGGDHRGRTFGHDLIMFPLAIYMLCSGKFVDGFYEDKIFKIIISSTNQNGNAYVGMNLGEALINYFLHMFADFFSVKSLPIPGFSLLTHFPARKIRKIANDLYKDGLNMRNLALQGVPVATTEIIIWIYNSLRYLDSDYSIDQIKNKKEKLLLISHGIATSVNIGKVIITKNPTSLNLVMIIRTIHLVWKVIKSEVEISHKAIEKLGLSTLQNKYKTLETLLLLDESIYYTKEIDKIILEIKHQHKTKLYDNKKKLCDGVSELDIMFQELVKLNKKG